MNTRVLNRALVVLPLAMLMIGNAQAAGAAHVDEDRGAMLYSTHCIACHTTEVHWREQRLATDWKTLKGQVRRWALNSGQHWEEDDVEAVANYLNRMYYDFPSDQQPKAVSQSAR